MNSLVAIEALYPTSNCSSPNCSNSAPNNLDGFDGAIIAFGPETDSVIDRFLLSDGLLPRLRILTTTVRSSRWEAVLRGEDWGMTYEQAVNLSRALLADIKNQKLVQSKVCTSYDLLKLSTESSPTATFPSC
jgi:hypothetical protein